MKNRSRGELVSAYSKIHKYLTDCGLKIPLKHLKNICVRRILSSDWYPLTNNKKKAEHDIRIYKDHMVNGLASITPEFYIHFWDHLIH